MNAPAVTPDEGGSLKTGLSLGKIIHEGHFPHGFRIVVPASILFKQDFIKGAAVGLRLRHGVLQSGLGGGPGPLGRDRVFPGRGIVGDFVQGVEIVGAVAREKGYTVDLNGFNAEMEKQTFIERRAL